MCKMKCVVYEIAHASNKNCYCHKAGLTIEHYIHIHIASIPLHAGKSLALLSFFIVFPSSSLSLIQASTSAM